MGFDFITLLELVFGLLIPVVILVYFACSKNRGQIAFDSVAYGFLSFLGSIVAVVIVLLFANAVFSSSLSFENDTSGLKVAGTIICVMVAVLFGFCETLKLQTIKMFQKRETKFKYPGVGFSAGVIIAQNIVVFIGLNVMSGYTMDASYALYSGAIVCFTGIMYVVLSMACERAMMISRSSAPAYGLSSVYYIFWIASIVCSSSTVILYIISALFFVLSFVLGGVFIFKNGRKSKGEGDGIDY